MLTDEDLKNYMKHATDLRSGFVDDKQSAEIIETLVKEYLGKCATIMLLNKVMGKEIINEGGPW